MRYSPPLTLLLAACLVLAAGCSEQTLSSEPFGDGLVAVPDASLQGAVVHHASLGGADICEALGLPTGCDANFSLVANQKADGSTKGQWQDKFAQGTGGIHVSIDCLNVQGNAAIVSGTITHGTAFGGDVSGQRALTAVVDNGTSANDTPDQLSFSIFDIDQIFGPGTDCNTFGISFFANNGLLFNLAHGQVKVR